MSTSAADGSNEFVVPRELAEVAERLGVYMITDIASSGRRGGVPPLTSVPAISTRVKWSRR
jgi:hypothetical protein